MGILVVRINLRQPSVVFSLNSIQQRDDQLSLGGGGFYKKKNLGIQNVSDFEGNRFLGVSYADFKTATIEVWSIL